MGVVGPPEQGHCRPGAGAPRRPLVALQCGGRSLDTGSQTPADGEDSSALDPSISHTETSSAGVLSRAPPPISLTPPRSRALQTLGTGPLSASPGSLCPVSTCWSLHIATGNLSLQPQVPLPTWPVLLNPPGPGPPPCEATGCPALSREAGWASSSPRRLWEELSPSAHVRGCRGPLPTPRGTHTLP